MNLLWFYPWESMYLCVYGELEERKREANKWKMTVVKNIFFALINRSWGGGVDDGGSGQYEFIFNNCVTQFSQLSTSKKQRIKRHKKERKPWQIPIINSILQQQASMQQWWLAQSKIVFSLCKQFAQFSMNNFSITSNVVAVAAAAVSL